jgi:hypothetical protein
MTQQFHAGAILPAMALVGAGIREYQILASGISGT